MYVLANVTDMYYSYLRSHISHTSLAGVIYMALGYMYRIYVTPAGILLSKIYKICSKCSEKCNEATKILSPVTCIAYLSGECPHLATRVNTPRP